ncbi:MAG: DUF1554 domain-containing protein [Alphaproteobacteria bacterium]|nr:DUF1554 domain-containing protein [Alphaproteobacteria bacterium]
MTRASNSLVWRWVLIALLAACSGPGAADTDTSDTDAPDPPVGGPLTIYYEGNGNFAVADERCASAAANPFPDREWRALLVGAGRVACGEPDCANGAAGQVDWVLAANTEYVSEFGESLGSTNENAIFEFPLLAMISGGGPAGNPWTGLNADWTVATGFTCEDWTNQSPDLMGRTGSISALDSNVISNLDARCSNGQGFICVEQP